jgi:hypothetical protein
MFKYRFDWGDQTRVKVPVVLALGASIDQSNAPFIKLQGRAHT